MFDFCGKTIPKCFEWFMALSGWEQFFLIAGLFIALLVFFRVAYKVLTMFD